MPKPLKPLLAVFSIFLFAGIFAMSWTHWQRLVGTVVADRASSGAGPGVGETSQPDAGAGAAKPSQSAESGSGQATTADSGTTGQTLNQSTDEGGADAAAAQPSFDLVRVGPGGDMVVAGRTAPDAAVELLSNGSVVATTKADAAGEFVFVPDMPLAAGGHDLALRTSGGDGVSIYSKNNVAVAVPEDTSGEVRVVMNEPGAASEILAKPDQPAGTDSGTDSGTDTLIAAVPPQTVESLPAVPEAKPQSLPQTTQSLPAVPVRPEPQLAQPRMAETTTGEKPAKSSGGRVADGRQAAPDVAPAAPVLLGVEAVEVEDGKLYAAGTARPGAIIRVYIDDQLTGTVSASDDGRWLLETEAKVPAGTVTVRADQLAPGGSNVVARIAMPFTRQFDTAVLIPRTAGGAPAGATAHGELTKPNAVIIRHGDNLWSISRRAYGNGMRYTTIFSANKNQIRDPDLIFPGQVFTLPHSDKNWAQ